MNEKTVEQYMEEMRALISLRKGAVNAVTEYDENSAEPLPLDGVGSLIVVVNSAEDRPLKGANVTVSDKDGKQLYNLVTDESGKTQAVQLAAPLKDNSLLPGTGIVYGLYNIKASADNFATSVLYNIPIFDSVVSIQQMRLLWLYAADGISNTEGTEAEPYVL